MTRTLVTGGLGYVGSRVVESLYSSGHDIAILSRSGRPVGSPLGPRVITADLTDAATLSGLADEGFDCCVHAAGLNHSNLPGYPELALRVNALGTRNLLAALSGSVGRFLYVSTVHIYGRLEGMIDESTPPSPLGDYATTHLFAEMYVRQFQDSAGISAAIVRLSNGYGAPRTMRGEAWNLLINALARDALRRGKLTLASNGTPLRDFVWLGDVGAAVAALLSIRPASCEVYNLSYGRSLSVEEVAHRVASRVAARTGRLIPIERNLSDTRHHPEQLEIRNRKLMAVCGLRFSDKIDEEIDLALDLLERG